MWPARIVLALVVACWASAPLRADEPAARQTLYPIYAHMPGSMHNDEAQRLFAAVGRRYRLGPVEVMDIPAPAVPRAPALLAAARPLVEKLKFAEAQAMLAEAVAEVIATGGAGLESAALADLFLTQAMAAQGATWKALSGPLTQIDNVEAREAYLRAAVLAPDRVLEAPRFPPLAIASFRLAAAEVERRPRGAIVVKASPGAEISIDGGRTQVSPATADGLRFGDHFVRIEEVGRRPWGGVALLSEPSLAVDAPRTEPLALDDGQAAAHARRMGARFALVATLKTGAVVELELALIDAASGVRRDASVIPFAAEAGALDAAVMRLDEEARKADLSSGGAIAPLRDVDLQIGNVPATPSGRGIGMADDPGGWARAHWPLLTAVGVAAGTAILLGIAVANDTRRPR
jgi:hypothetical protein